MYRVLVVDDEQPVLDSYEYLIQQEGHGFTLEAKARNGIEAFDLIQRLRPDVVLLDIRMPGLDGLEVIAKTHALGISPVFILSTAYERFDLAQKAIPLGVRAYLVKPVSRSSFFQALLDAKTVLEERKLQNQQVSLSQERAQKEFFSEALWRVLSRQEWDGYRAVFSLHSDKMAAVLLEIEEGVQARVLEIVHALQYRYRCLHCSYLSMELLLIAEDVDIDRVRDYLSKEMEARLPQDTFYLLGYGACRSGNEVYLSIQDALQEIRAQRKQSERRGKEILNLALLRRSIGIADRETVFAAFRAFWSEVCSAYGYELAKVKISCLFILLLDDAQRITGVDDALVDIGDPVVEIAKAANQQECEAWCLQALQAVHLWFDRYRNRNLPQALIKAMQIVQTRYMEPLQLSTVAEQVFISSAYLSRLFTEHLSTTFVDYLTALRLEKAEQLIQNTGMNIKEIAYAVGYQDPNYFAKIFRRVTGIPPSAYAAHSREKRI